MSTSVVRALGRSGYVARSALYGLVGVMACQQAMTGRGRADFAGAFVLLHAAGGPALLLMTAIALWGYALWRWTEALRNPEGRPVWSRQDIAVRGACHAWLGMTAARIALVDSPEPHPVGRWVGATAAYPFGHVLVFAGGVALLWFACAEARLARRGEITTHFDYAHAQPETRTAVHYLGRIGMAGRAVVFGLVAIAVVWRSLHPGKVNHVDLADILADVCSSGVGRVLVFSTGVALASYGVYLGILAWRRRIPA